MTEPSPEPCHPHTVDGGVGIGATGKMVELNTAATTSPSSSSKKSTDAALQEAKKTIANIQKLSLLETITMHRFRHGGDSDDPVLICELEFFLQRSLSKGGPFLCKTDLYGPDTLHIARNTAALEYLKGLGFKKVTEEFERKAERVVYDVVPEKSGLGALSSTTNDPKAREDAFYATSTEDGIATADDENGSPGTPGSTCTTATSITTKNTTIIGYRHYLQLASVPTENSAEWQHLKQSVTKALAELERARTMNCGLLRVMLHRFIFFHNMATEYRVEVVAKEADPYATLLLQGQGVTRRGEPLSSKPQSGAPSAATTPSGAAKRGNAINDDEAENEDLADHADATDVDPEFAAALAAAKRAVQIKKGKNSGTSANEDGFVVLPDPSAATTNSQQQQQQRTTVNKPRSSSAGPLAEETHISQYFSLDDATVLPSLIASAVHPSLPSTTVNTSPSVYGTLSPSAAAGSSLSTAPLTTSPSSASGPSGRSLPPPPAQVPTSASGAPQTQLTLFQNMMASFDLKKICGPCTVDINVYRARTIRGDKLKAVGTLAYDNSAPLRREVDLKDPRAPAGLPIGRITVEIDSVRLRYYTLKALEHFVEKHTSGEGAEEAEAEGVEDKDDAVLDEHIEGTNNSDSSEEESGINTISTVSHTAKSTAPWIEQQAIIEAAARRLRSGARSEPSPSTAAVEAHSSEGRSEATGPSAAAAAATSQTPPRTLPRGVGDDDHTTAAIGVGGVITGGDYTVGKYDADDYF